MVASPSIANYKKGGKDPFRWGSVWTPQRMYELTESLKEFVEENVSSGKKYLISEWCFENGVMPRRLPHLCTKCPDFKAVWELARDFEEHSIVSQSLKNQCNYKFASLYLAKKHNWDASNQNKEATQKSSLDKIIERMDPLYEDIRERDPR